MMGGFLVSCDRGLYDLAVKVLEAMGAVSAVDEDGGGLVQLADDGGRLFTLYERVPEGSDWEVREGPFVPAEGVDPPDMEFATACPFECRWPEVAVRFISSIATSAKVRTWVLDGDGVIWDAAAVDPLRVRL